MKPAAIWNSTLNLHVEGYMRIIFRGWVQFISVVRKADELFTWGRLVIIKIKFKKIILR
jgi:hypothetical protein